ncbi:hypothetical protein PTSG_10589 [Salpingoeca rosetta]|uniref:JAB1/MPN/MOV34 metalloenzyme domain-containing protein n=1 Tax=Salpingoeca rosetta (strain ATCC 50818 / BSB-021) TaxID=946362 RepID=F2URT1_SALR5|nr:uncharacterized protein PTSG_10589 [Salpingoeca rosetta]EGD80336.1 hypothetical protein PTSG_10589 [Salpingoeca rosetta]|eukprot:XP_004988126.1 hypothetical protein PTSG_10589 [Salpingoeca rosetta]
MAELDALADEIEQMKLDGSLWDESLWDKTPWAASMLMLGTRWIEEAAESNTSLRRLRNRIIHGCEEGQTFESMCFGVKAIGKAPLQGYFDAIVKYASTVYDSTPEADRKLQYLVFMHALDMAREHFYQLSEEDQARLGRDPHIRSILDKLLAVRALGLKDKKDKNRLRNVMKYRRNDAKPRININLKQVINENTTSYAHALDVVGECFSEDVRRWAEDAVIEKRKSTPIDIGSALHILKTSFLKLRLPHDISKLPRKLSSLKLSEQRTVHHKDTERTVDLLISEVPELIDLLDVMLAVSGEIKAGLLGPCSRLKELPDIGPLYRKMQEHMRQKAACQSGGRIPAPPRVVARGTQEDGVCVDALVVMKLAKFARGNVGEQAVGSLIGMQHKRSVELTDCFMVPGLLSGPDDEDGDIGEGGNDEATSIHAQSGKSSQEYKDTMLNAMRAVNADYDEVGIFQVSDARSLYDKDLILHLYNYQTSTPLAIVLVYDPTAVEDNALSIRAFRLSALMLSFLEATKPENLLHVGPDELRVSGGRTPITTSSVFVEVPLQLHTSVLARAAIPDLAQQAQVEESPDLDVSRFLDDHITTMMKCIDELSDEAVKYHRFKDTAARQPPVADFFQEFKHEHGRPPTMRELQAKFPEERLETPSGVQSLLVNSQISAYCDQVAKVAARGIAAVSVSGTISAAKNAGEPENAAETRQDE